MKRWLGNAGLTMSSVYYWAGKIPDYLNAAKYYHNSNLLPSTVYQTEDVSKVDNAMLDNSSFMKLYSLEALLKTIKNKVLEIANFFSEPDYFYDTGDLPNINFKDLKFAVVDIRNIDYLMQDF